MEVTKWLKPSISVSRIGDSASVQAATRVNAKQASKRTMCRPTRLPYRGRLIRLDDMSEAICSDRCAGVVAAACTQVRVLRTLVGRHLRKSTGELHGRAACKRARMGPAHLMPPNRSSKIVIVSMIVMITITMPRGVTSGSGFRMMRGGAT